ncbi:chondroitin sulfate proteoglycan 5-like [Plectropomus leopardus]|uniref:chondroitin sulfate proteoglycan 5-like n=1 Tax=Plectropomus leopardus TaxID=160734 RepID=UPI001C4DBE13|nr:chondroitin sulfate proteoglycan 5-like [Plectropomus leopardus]
MADSIKTGAGNVIETNATETDAATNVTTLMTEDEGPVKVNEDIATVTGTSSSASPDSVTQRAGRIPRGGDEDEQSSGMLGETMSPALEEVGAAAPPQLSPDSAETEHLLPGNPRRPDIMESEEEEEHLPHTDPPWIHDKDTAVFDLDRFFTTTTAAAQPAAPTNPSNPDVLHVDFFDPSSHGHGLNLAPPSPSSLAHELQGGDPTSWAMPDNYDYLTPYEDGVSPTADEYTYSTTTDAYEGDEDPRLRSRPRAPGSGSFIPGIGVPVPNVPVAAPPAAAPVDGSDGMGGCRVGYQMVNGSCRSPCDTLPNYCFNGGQCYLLEGMGVFCRYDMKHPHSQVALTPTQSANTNTKHSHQHKAPTPTRSANTNTKHSHQHKAPTPTRTILSCLCPIFWSLVFKGV